MANRVFLFRTDRPPEQALAEDAAERDESDTHEDAFEATASAEIPLLWLPFYRRGDLRSYRSNDPSGDMDNRGLLVGETDQCLRNFRDALSIYARLFPELRSLGQQAVDLTEAIEHFPGRLLLLDFTELEWFDRKPGECRQTIMRQLAFLASPHIEIPPKRRGLLRRFRAPSTQEQLRRELLGANANLVDKRPDGDPYLIGGPGTGDWPSGDRWATGV